MSSQNYDLRKWVSVASTVVDFWLPIVVVPDNAVDNLGNGHVFGFGFGLDPFNKGLFNVQCPAHGQPVSK